MNSLIIKLFMLVSLVKVIYSVEYAFEAEGAYRVLEREEIVFTCTYGGTIDIWEYPIGEDSIRVVEKSRVLDDRFTYTNVTKNGKLVHRFGIIDIPIPKYDISYLCRKTASNSNLISISVYHRQVGPTCITNYYTKQPYDSTYFECSSKLIYPPTRLDTLIPLDEDTSYSTLENYDYNVFGWRYDRNSTHVFRKLSIVDAIDDISVFRCIAYQTSPSGFVDRKECTFKIEVSTSNPPTSNSPNVGVTPSSNSPNIGVSPSSNPSSSNSPNVGVTPSGNSPNVGVTPSGNSPNVGVTPSGNPSSSNSPNVGVTPSGNSPNVGVSPSSDDITPSSDDITPSSNPSSSGNTLTANSNNLPINANTPTTESSRLDYSSSGVSIYGSIISLLICVLASNI